MDEGNLFENVIASLPEKGERTNPSSELVVFSRVIDITALVICDTKNDIALEILKKIETRNRYIKRKQFNKLLKTKYALPRKVVKDNITKLYIVKENEKQTFLGGCDFLLQWYLNRVKELNNK